MQSSFRFHQSERLKSRKQIGLLFQNRQSIGAYPLRIFWRETENDLPYPAQIAFTVSKKTFKSAVKRNRYKRLMREAHRLNKHVLYDFLNERTKKLNLMLLYVGKDDIDYKTIEKKYLQLIFKLKKEL